MPEAAVRRRSSIAATIFSRGARFAADWDIFIVVAVLGGVFSTMFVVQPVMMGLKIITDEALAPWLSLTLFNTPQYSSLISRVIVEIVVAVVVLHFFALSPAFLIWLERKVSGRIQSRYGPMHVGGFHGWLQTIADGIKLISKEDIIPGGADKVLHTIGPIMVVVAAVTGFVVIPFGNELVPRDFNIGIFYLLAVTSVSVFGVVVAGWASNNKYSLLGGMRSAAQLVSYEIPRGVSLIGVIMLAQSLQMGTIVSQQSGIGANGEAFLAIPYIVFQPIAFIIYVIASIAETNRAPFDLPEAESELVAGFHTEYSGMKFAFFFMAEYGEMLLFSCVATALFLGGGSIPIVEGYLYGWTNGIFDSLHVPFLRGFWHFPVFMIKTYVLVFFYIWVRWTFPRLRVDRLMDFSWKILVPWTFVNLIGLGIALLPQFQPIGVWVFAAINWLIVGGVLLKAFKK
ncbi:MAG: NADH-quinone oxidoreductase subunit NuoH [Planctomycetota bacterium]|nr:NADH-quinone oxidoreductase subunit NuoH [Planctomycetota bacterium]